MRQRLCARCGKIYLSDNVDSRLCPDCVNHSRKTVTVKRVCTVCGASFDGYPRSKYCPDCAIEARRARDRQQKRAGAKRPIGSTDTCDACGKPYTVSGGLQRYCPDCAAAAVRENVLRHKRDQRTKNRDVLNARHQDLRGGRRRICVVCSKPFASSRPTITCSPECASEHRSQQQKKYDKRRSSRHK